MIRKILMAALLAASFKMSVAQSKKISIVEPDTNKVVIGVAEKSPIKSLTDQQYLSYKTGIDTALSNTAALNGYPGPESLLKLEKELKLSPVQVSQLKSIIKARQFKAQEMGGFILQQEKKLNDFFAANKADEGLIIYYTNKIGLYLGELRNAHLQANLKSKRVLNPEQVSRYKRIAGNSN